MTRFKILNVEKEISGEKHFLVEHTSGHRYYLDTVFITALKMLDKPERDECLRTLGVKSDEIPLIIQMLRGADLIAGDDIS